MQCLPTAIFLHLFFFLSSPSEFLNRLFHLLIPVPLSACIRNSPDLEVQYCLQAILDYSIFGWPTWLKPSTLTAPSQQVTPRLQPARSPAVSGALPGWRNFVTSRRTYRTELMIWETNSRPWKSTGTQGFENSDKPYWGGGVSIRENPSSKDTGLLEEIRSAGDYLRLLLVW